MPEQVTITIRNKEYPVTKLHGINVIGLIQELYFQDSVLDPAKIPNIASALRRTIPDIPATVISDDAIYLQPDEFYAFVDDFRAIYFKDNLEDCRKRSDYKGEYEYGRGYATYQAYLELRKKLRKEREESWDWKLTQDVRLGIDDAPDDRTWYFFEKYYTDQIAIANKEGNTQRETRLLEILKQAKLSFEAYIKTSAKPISSNDVIDENAELRRRLAELESEKASQKTEKAIA